MLNLPTLCALNWPESHLSNDFSNELRCQSCVLKFRPLSSKGFPAHFAYVTLIPKCTQDAPHGIPLQFQECPHVNVCISTAYHCVLVRTREECRSLEHGVHSLLWSDVTPTEITQSPALGTLRLMARKMLFKGYRKETTFFLRVPNSTLKTHLCDYA